MSVYTSINRNDLEEMLKKYTIGKLVDFSGVEDGIENTTYFIDTEKEDIKKEQVLTIFEHISTEMLEEYTQLLAFLSKAAIQVPNPINDSAGKPIQILKGKPAILSPKLAGSHISTPKQTHCEQIGIFLAKLHTETESYPQPIPKACDYDWIKKQAQLLINKLTSNEKALMESALTVCDRVIPKYKSLPRAVIHGDLFVDNALFKENTLTGVIDFYSAGSDFMLMDIAVAINDWCVDSAGAINIELMNNLLSSYQTVRLITEAEQQALKFFLYLAALRFWTLRLKVKIQNDEQSHSGDLIKFKDPTWFYEILKMRETNF